MALSGQITVSTAGTAVQGTNQPGTLFAIKAHPDNADTIWAGNDDAGDVTSSNGFPLNPSDAAVIVQAANLNQFWFDADANGDKVCWLRLN